MPVTSTGDVSEHPPVAVLAERLKERIYAELTVVAVVLGLAAGGAESAGAAALSVAGTVLGLWLATIAADHQAHLAAYGHRPRGHELRRMLFVSSALLIAAVGPLLLIALSALGALELTAALYVSAGISLAIMFAWGLGIGRRMGAGLVAALVSGAVNVAIGGLVVAVKLLAGH
ncbi:hypothetical protein GCM10023204_23900 [Actinomycetospora succinea]